MSKTALLIALAIAFVLALGTYLVTTKQRPAPAPSRIAWLASLDGSPPGAIIVERGGTPVARIERGPQTGDWLLITSEGSGAARTCPVNSSNARAAVRLLGDLASAAAQPAGGSLGAATTLTLRLPGGERKIRLADAGVGGKILVQLPDDAGVTRTVGGDAALATIFQRGGLLGWRRLNLFAHEGFDPSRLRVELNGRAVQAARGGGRWLLSAPFAAPVDNDAFAAFRTRLADLPFARIIDDRAADDPTLALANPSGSIRAETDLKIPKGDAVLRRVLIEEVRIGGPADLGGASVFAVASARLFDPMTNSEEALWGPTVGVVERARLDAARPVVTDLVTKRCLATPVADIRSIRLEPWRSSFESSGTSASAAEHVTLARGLSGWERAGGTKASLPGDDEKQLDALLRLLAETPASAVMLKVPDGAEPLARLSVNFGDGAGESVILGLAQSAGKTRMVVRAGPWAWGYDGAAIEPLARWIAVQLKIEG